MSYQRRASTEPEPNGAEILCVLLFVAGVVLGWFALWNILGEELGRQFLH